MNYSLVSKSSFWKTSPIVELLFLWLLACLIAVWKLGDVPLRDFDEATVARVAFELSYKDGLERLLPSLWGTPYLNKPPGLHWLIAGVIALTRNNQLSEIPSEFSIRLIPALFSTLVVPLGGLIQYRLRPNDKTASLCTSIILLTLMPIIRHGRLAMLDGTQLTLIAILWLFLVSVDINQVRRWQFFGAGFAGSLMLMLKAPLLIPAAFAAFIPLFWSGFPLKVSVVIRSATCFFLGLLPGISWHIWHGFHRGAAALWLWFGDGAGRVLFDAGEGSSLGWRVPVIEIFEGGWPWLVLWPFALVWAWRERNNRWGQWTICLQLILALSIFPLKTQLPWYSHPLWLPISLLCGVPLAWLIHKKTYLSPPVSNALKYIPYFWSVLGIIIFVLSSLGITGIVNSFRPYSSFAIPIGLGWALGGWLMSLPSEKQRICGVISLSLGSFLGLMILMGSSLWLWELNENWPVEVPAKLALRSSGSEIVIEGHDERPSLNWYAGKRIGNLKAVPKAELILTRNPKKFLAEQMANSQQCLTADQEEDWTLLSCTSINF